MNHHFHVFVRLSFSAANKSYRIHEPDELGLWLNYHAPDHKWSCSARENSPSALIVDNPPPYRQWAKLRITGDEAAIHFKLRWWDELRAKAGGESES